MGDEKKNEFPLGAVLSYNWFEKIPPEYVLKDKEMYTAFAVKYLFKHEKNVRAKSNLIYNLTKCFDVDKFKLSGFRQYLLDFFLRTLPKSYFRSFENCFTSFLKANIENYDGIEEYKYRYIVGKCLCDIAMNIIALLNEIPFKNVLAELTERYQEARLSNETAFTRVCVTVNFFVNFFLL